MPSCSLPRWLWLGCLGGCNGCDPDIAMAGWHQKWRDLHAAQGGKCWLCGNEMSPAPARKLKNGKYNNGFTKDHIVPVSAGGTREANILLAHQWCNNRRGNKAPTETELQYLRRLLNGGNLPSKRLWNGKKRF